MKITRIETIPVRVPLKQQLAIRSGKGNLQHTVSPFLLVKIHTDEPHIGLGEVSCTPRWSGEDQVTAAHFIQTYIAPLLIGEEATDINRLSLKIKTAIAGNPFTKAAVEMALWDLLGKSLNTPVYKLLGGAIREFVPTKWSVSGVEPAQAADIARWAVAQGFTCMKVKVGGEPAADLARVRAVREAVGSGVRLGVDANGGWPAFIAADMIDRLREFDIFFIEQPIAPGDDAALANLRQRAKAPIIADESLYTPQDAIALARAGAADLFSVYIGKSGGIAAARQIAAIAESAGIGCTVGSNLEMGIGSAAMIHLAIATSGITPDFLPCDIIGPFFYEDDLLQQPLPIIGGAARAPDGPGLGVVLNDEKVERYRVSQSV
jgi:L-alanine-DL-glutamate epimerase-like enolase superfamily enzyme